MKKIILTVFAAILAFGISAQTTEQANKPLTNAQQATLDLVKAYDLDAEQAQKVLKIQELKFSNLAEVETLRNNMRQYVVKRFSALNMAQEQIANLLTPEQYKKYAQWRYYNDANIENLKANMTKQGLTEDDINKKLANIIY